MQHSEMFPLLKKDGDNTFELFQIWLNLPAHKKFVEPAYKMLWNKSIPKLALQDNNQNNIKIEIVAGNLGDAKAPGPAPDSWAADLKNEVAIWQIVLDENACWEIPIAANKVNRSLYFFEGETR